MTRHRTAGLLLAGALLLAPLLAGCSDDGDEPGASASTSTAAARPTEAPVPDGPVSTGAPVVVVDAGEGAVMCPARNAGSAGRCQPSIPLDGWDWSEQEDVQKAGGTRVGQYVLTGTYDGTTFTVEKSVPAAKAPTDADTTPAPPPLRQYSEADLLDIAEEAAQLPGVTGVVPVQGQVLVDVVYDDGTLQAWADQEFGENTVVVSSALVSR